MKRGFSTILPIVVVGIAILVGSYLIKNLILGFLGSGGPQTATRNIVRQVAQITLSDTAQVTGTLGFGNGGTNATGFTANNIVVVNSAGTALTSSSTLTVSAGGMGTTTITSGHILFGAGSGSLLTNSNLFWSNSNSRLGLSSTTPSSELSVSGSATTTLYLNTTGTLTGSCIVMLTATSTAPWRLYIGSAGTLITEAGSCK